MNQIVHRILMDHFPTTFHDDIMDAIQMPWVVATKGQVSRRDPTFRQKILDIYKHSCAVCGFDGSMGGRVFAIEAAHIKWHAAKGPDTQENGIALCSFHHKVFDRGAMGLLDDRRIVISTEVQGQQGVEEWLLRFSGQPMREPVSGLPPATEFIRWHQKEVFREPAR